MHAGSEFRLTRVKPDADIIFQNIVIPKGVYTASKSKGSKADRVD